MDIFPDLLAAVERLVVTLRKQAEAVLDEARLVESEHVRTIEELEMINGNADVVPPLVDALIQIGQMSASLDS
jgi:hypothetical protein